MRELDRAGLARTDAPARRIARRLLPGAATVGVLVGAWLGLGSLVGLQAPKTVPIPGSTRVGSAYVYVARPGDTLWGIASAVEPGSDPRPLVAELEQQLGGAQLVPGDRLRLP